MTNLSCYEASVNVLGPKGELIQPKTLFQHAKRPGNQRAAWHGPTQFLSGLVGIGEAEAASNGSGTAAQGNEGVLGNLIVRIGKRLLPATLKGSLQLTLPSGKQILIGTPGEGFSADLTLRNFKVIWASVRRAQLGFLASGW
jgi:hypothetical protein